MAANRSAIKAVLLPSEHGSWAFVLEPVLLGTLVSRSFGGLFVVFAALFGFLAYRPLKLGLRDVFARKSYSRTRIGLVFGTLFLTASVALFVLGWSEQFAGYWYAVGAFALLALLFVVFDSRLPTGAVGRELLGAVMTVPLAPAAFWAGEVNPSFLVVAVGLPLLCLAKSVPTVFYVRARLRPRKDRGSQGNWAVGLGVLGLILVGLFEVAAGPVPLFVFVFALLLGRIVWGLSKIAQDLPPKHVGLQEFAYSLTFLLLLDVMSG